MLAIVLAGSFLGFVLSSTVGVGGAIVMVSLLSLVVPAASAVALATPVMLVNNLGKLVLLRGALNWPFLRGTLFGAIPGAAFGATLVGLIPELWLKRLIGAFMLGYVAWELRRNEKQQPKMERLHIASWGVVTGLTAALVGAGGPTNSASMNAAGLTKQAFVATGAAISVAIQLVKLPIFVGNGALRLRDLPLGAALCLIAIFAAYLGRALLDHISDRIFRQLLLVSFVALGLLMLR